MFESKVVDKGDVVAGTTIEAEFVCENRGTSDAVVTSFGIGCSCITVPTGKIVVPAKKRIPIPITVETKDDPRLRQSPFLCHDFERSVVVEFAPPASSTVVTIHARLVPEIIVPTKIIELERAFDDPSGKLRGDIVIERGTLSQEVFQELTLDFPVNGAVEDFRNDGDSIACSVCIEENDLPPSGLDVVLVRSKAERNDIHIDDKVVSLRIVKSKSSWVVTPQVVFHVVQDNPSLAELENLTRRLVKPVGVENRLAAIRIHDVQGSEIPNWVGTKTTTDGLLIWMREKPVRGIYTCSLPILVDGGDRHYDFIRVRYVFPSFLSTNQ